MKYLLVLFVFYIAGCSNDDSAERYYSYCLNKYTGSIGREKTELFCGCVKKKTFESVSLEEISEYNDVRNDGGEYKLLPQFIYIKNSFKKCSKLI